MDEVDGARTFGVAGTAYDSFMGRYSVPLSERFADAAGVIPGQTALDVGCGPGALTGVLVGRLGANSVSACDPSPSFLADCTTRHPGIDTKPGRAEAIPFETDRFDHALAQLVFHFVSEPETATHEMARVVRPGGTISACVWDFADGMEMLRLFWDAALAVNPDAPDEARTMRFGQPGEIAQLLEAAGMTNIEESTLHVSSTYRSFGELWDGFLIGVGPAGAYCTSLADENQSRVRDELFRRLGSPDSSFTLGAVARCATGRVPE